MWGPMRTPVSARAVMTPSRAEVAAEITAQVIRRGAGKTICPSEVARALAKDWRILMPLIRDNAADMAGRGEITVTQKGQRVVAADAKGPIRLGL